MQEILLNVASSACDTWTVVCSRLCVPVNRRNLHLQRTVSGNLQCSENQSLAWLPRTVFSGHARGRHFAPVSAEL